MLAQQVPTCVKVAQGLLLRSNIDSANPVEFFAQHGQLTGLGRVVDGLPCTGLELPPLIAALLKCNGVNEATDASKLHEQGYLFITRMQFVLIAALFHATDSSLKCNTLLHPTNGVVRTEMNAGCCAIEPIESSLFIRTSTWHRS